MLWVPKSRPSLADEQMDVGLDTGDLESEGVEVLTAVRRVGKCTVRDKLNRGIAVSRVSTRRNIILCIDDFNFYSRYSIAHYCASS